MRAAAETVQALSAAAKKYPDDAGTAAKLDEAGEALGKAMQTFRDAEQMFLSELVEKTKK